ncbi:hypothetical protein ACP3V3_01910 [Vibrio sp. PNB22_3_1]
MNMYTQSTCDAALAKYLRFSSLTPGSYVPSDDARSSKHWAIFVDKAPILLFGYEDCAISRDIAAELSCSEVLAATLGRIGVKGRLTWGLVDGAAMLWDNNYTAVVRSMPGLVEVGGVDELQVINLTQNTALTTMMCVLREIGSILDANFPEYDDTPLLEALSLVGCAVLD